VQGEASEKVTPSCMVRVMVLVPSSLYSLARPGMTSPVAMFQRSKVSYTICITLAAAGQAAVGDSGLKVAGGPHWKPAISRLSPVAPARPLPTWPLLPTPSLASVPPVAPVEPVLAFGAHAARARPPIARPPILMNERRDGFSKTESDIEFLLLTGPAPGSVGVVESSLT